MGSRGEGAEAEAGQSARQLFAPPHGPVRAAATVLLIAGFLWLATARPGPGEAHIAARLLGTLMQLSETQRLFAESCGRGGYAASVDQLLIVFELDNVSISGDPPLLLDARSDLPGRLAGIEIGLEPAPGAAAGARDCRNRPTTTQFYASATLRRSDWHGPSFAMATDGEIWRSETTEPPRQPFGAPATRQR